MPARTDDSFPPRIRVSASVFLFWTGGGTLFLRFFFPDRLHSRQGRERILTGSLFVKKINIFQTAEGTHIIASSRGLKRVEDKTQNKYTRHKQVKLNYRLAFQRPVDKVSGANGGSERWESAIITDGCRCGRWRSESLDKGWKMRRVACAGVKDQ